MSVVYRLIGYNHGTDRMAIRFDVPGSVVDRAKQIAGIHEKDDTQVGDWELTPVQAGEIAALMKVQVASFDYAFFLEPYVFTDDLVQR